MPKLDLTNDMRQIRDFFVTCCLLILLTSASGQCIPDTFSSPGFYPDSLDGLDCGSDGSVSYSTTMHYKSKLDTNVSIPLPPFTITVPIDSFKILSIAGLPVTFDYACNTSDCTIDGNPSNPPGSNTLCWEISGNPSVAGLGTYNLNITIRSWMTVPIVGVQFFDVINTDYSIKIIQQGSSSVEIMDSHQFIRGLQNGIVLQDSLGKCWKFFTNANGNINSEMVTCPN